MITSPLSIYIHIPFCYHRCAYCDFNTYAGVTDLIPAYVDALNSEIGQLSVGVQKRAPKTLFFGGGTPSLLTPGSYEKIFRQLGNIFDLSELSEISLESNPGTLRDGYFKDLKSIGFNRVSLGVQSSNSRFLKFLERAHDYQDVISSVEQIRKAGIENINLDLIYSLPGQTLPDWEVDLKKTLELQTPHISLYSLGIENGTPLANWYSKGLIEWQNDDLAADQYELAETILEEKGFEHYEISNWAMEGYECQHNMAYWRNNDYIGLGAGAHGHFNGKRYSVVPGLRSYIKAAYKNDHSDFGEFPITSANQDFTHLSPKESLQDALMVGLRLLKEGVNLDHLSQRYQIDVSTLYKAEIEKLLKDELIEIENGRMRLTRRARFISNQVFSVFVGD